MQLIGRTEANIREADYIASKKGENIAKWQRKCHNESQSGIRGAILRLERLCIT